MRLVCCCCCCCCCCLLLCVLWPVSARHTPHAIPEHEAGTREEELEEVPDMTVKALGAVHHVIDTVIEETKVAGSDLERSTTTRTRERSEAQSQYARQLIALLVPALRCPVFGSAQVSQVACLNRMSHASLFVRYSMCSCLCWVTGFDCVHDLLHYSHVPWTPAQATVTPPDLATASRQLFTMASLAFHTPDLARKVRRLAGAGGAVMFMWCAATTDAGMS